MARSTRVAVGIIFFTFSPAEVPSATLEPQALYLDLRRVNERNQKVLSRAIYQVCNTQLAQNRRGSMWDIRQRARGAAFVAPECTTYIHTWYQSYPSSHCTITTICFTAGLYTSCFEWWVDGILLLLLYSYIIIIPVVRARFAVTATAAAAANRLQLHAHWSFGCGRGG